MPRQHHGRTIHSCARCRQLKVRCDRAKPDCGRCARAGASCSFPSEVPLPRKAGNRRKRGAGSDHGQGQHFPWVAACCGELAPASLSLDAEAVLEYRSPDESSLSTPSQTLAQPRATPTYELPRLSRKRDRAILSCLRCRKHKVRCDRGRPCGRCLKLDRGAECVYDGRSASGSPPMPSKDRKILDDIAAKYSRGTCEYQFRNGTYWRELIREIHAHLRVDYKPVPTQHAPAVGSLNFPFGDATPTAAPSPDALLAALPPRPVQETFICHYMNTVERAYRLLDEETWGDELETFWAGRADLGDDWLAQYLMVLSLGCQAQNFAAQGTGSDAYPLWPSRLLRGAEVCLKRTPFLFQPTLANIRTLCLMVVSKQVDAMSCQASDTCWPLTGIILRLSISMGLHTSGPSSSSSFAAAAAKKKKPNRRLWAAVVFLEMRQSLLCGMPLLLRPCDVASLAATKEGVAVSETHSQRGEHPRPTTRTVGPDGCARRPSSSSLLESLFGRCAPLLLRAIHLATCAARGDDNDADDDDDDDDATYAQVVEVDAALRDELRRSDASVLRHRLPLLDERPVDLEPSMIELFFRQTLIALHSRFTLRPAPSARHAVSHVSSLESALAILSLQRSLFDGGESGDGHGRKTAATSARWFAGLFRYEFFLAAMTVCYHLVRGHGGWLLGRAAAEAGGRESRTPQDIMLDALQSCRDVWRRDKDVSVCNANAYALVDRLVCVLRGSGEDTAAC